MSSQDDAYRAAINRISRGPLYYAPDGTPLTLHEWAELLERRHETVNQDENWWRKRTRISENVEISTVWLGLDHSHGFGLGPPLIWETMIFGGKHDSSQWRYPTRQTALDHHEQIIAALRNNQNPQ